MASLSEVLQLAQFQMQNKQMNNPLANITELGVSVGKGYENMQNKKTKNRLMEMINTGKDASDIGWSIDEEGKVKFTKSSRSEINKNKVYSIGDKIVKYDPNLDNASVVYDAEDSTKKVEAEIKNAVASGLPLTKNQKDYYNKFMAPSAYRTPFEEEEDLGSEPEEKKPSYDPNSVTSWDQVPLMSRLAAALTPSATPEEQRLGGLRPGGVFNAPKKKEEPAKEKPQAKSFSKDIVLDPKIKTTSEAVAYLIKNYGMSQSDAIDWLRNQ